MPRKKRIEDVDAIQHVWAHSIRNEPLFGDDADRHLYLRLLEGGVTGYGWRLFAYCLMSTHVHLLIQTPVPNLGEGMKWMHGEYARLFNARHGFRGHLFERRFGSERQRTDAQLKVTAAYIANNPVKAGIVRRPEEWKWGSHGETVDGIAPPWLDANRLLDHFGASGGDPLERYRRFVEEWARK